MPGGKSWDVGLLAFLIVAITVDGWMNRWKDASEGSELSRGNDNY